MQIQEGTQALQREKELFARERSEFTLFAQSKEKQIEDAENCYMVTLKPVFNNRRNDDIVEEEKEPSLWDSSILKDMLNFSTC